VCRLRREEKEKRRLGINRLVNDQIFAFPVDFSNDAVRASPHPTALRRVGMGKNSQQQAQPRFLPAVTASQY